MLHRELDVHQADDMQFPRQPGRRRMDLPQHRLRQVARRNGARRVAGVDARLLHMLHDRADDGGLAVGEAVHVQLLGVAQEFVDEAVKMLTGIANKKGEANKKGNITPQVIIYSKKEIERIAQAVKATIDEDGDIKKFKKRTAKEFDKLRSCAEEKPISADIALFGRMVTSPYLADVDAAMQVAHAISTHAVNRESDYFTAVDDLIKQNDDDDSGAAMIGDVDYNSCCYYEYVSVDTDILRENLKNSDDCEQLIRKLIPVLIKAIAFTNPSGKQNTFAGQVLPDMVMIECKKDKIPLSYVNAFETPVKAWGNQPNLVKNSVEQFVSHVDCMDCAYELPVMHRAYFAPRFSDVKPASCDSYDRFSALTAACAEWIKEDGQE